MENIVKMAGNYMSHAIWSVESGETLTPILGYLKSDGSTLMQRLAMDSIRAMEVGDKSLSNLEQDVRGAVFIKDGYITLDSGRTDALIADVRFGDDRDKKLQFIIPYRNANEPAGFALHRLKITELKGISKDVANSLAHAFMDGLESHEQGGNLWREKYVDQAGVSGGGGVAGMEFTGEEFDLLKKSVFLVFFIVAAADGTVDRKELLAFIKLLSDPNKISNPLLVRIITNVINEVQIIVSELAAKKPDYIQELTNLQILIDNKLPETEANEFKLSLLMLGKEIAEASGGFFGFGNKISKEEKGALAAIALCLGVTIS